MLNTQHTITAYGNIIKFFVDRGLTYWDASEKAKKIDEFVIMDLVDRLVSDVERDTESSDRLDMFLSTGPSRAQLCLYLGVDEEEFEKQHIESLEEVHTKLPEALMLAQQQARAESHVSTQGV